MKKILIFLLFFSYLWGMDLKEAIEIAKKNNKKLQMEKQNLIEKEQDCKDALSNFLPKISLSGGVNYQKNNYPDSDLDNTLKSYSYSSTSEANLTSFIMGIISKMSYPEKQTILSAGLSLTQPIYTGGKISAGLSLAKKAYEASIYSIQMVERDLVFDTKKYFYTILLAQKTLDLQNEALDLAKKHFEKVANMYKQGVVSEYDFLRAKLEVTKTEPEVLQAESNYKIIVQNFKNLLALDEDSLVINDSLVFTEKNIFSLDSSIALCKKNRTELKLSKINSQIYQKAYEIKKKAFYPDIALNAEYNKYSSSTSSSIETDNFGDYYSISLGLSYPLFTGFSRTANIEKAKAAYKRVNLSAEDLQAKLILDLKNNYYTLNENYELYLSAKENMKIAQKGYSIAKQRYENNLSDQLEVLDAQIQLNSTKLSYQNSIFNYIMSYEYYKKTIGENL